MYVLRFDHVFNPYNSMMVRYAQEDERQEDIGAGGTRLKGSGFTQHIPAARWWAPIRGSRTTTR